MANKLITDFEGLRLEAYADPIKGWSVPTIGYGTTVYPDGTKVKHGDVITKEQAEEYLQWHIDKRIVPVLSKIPNWSKLNKNQKIALISFAYNLGSFFYNSKKFTSITYLCDHSEMWNNEGYVRSTFAKYSNGGNKGLLRRRSAEAELFCEKI